MRMSAKTKTSTKPKASARAKASAKVKMSARATVRTKAKMSAETKNRYRVLEKEESDRIVEIGLITFSRDHKLEVVSAASQPAAISGLDCSDVQCARNYPRNRATPGGSGTPRYLCATYQAIGRRLS
jgi:hypothetical protein